MFVNFSHIVMPVLRRLSALSALFRFRAHNRKVFGTGVKKSDDAPIMLMELNTMHSAHIAYAYLADEMAKSRGAQIKAYAPHALENVKQKLAFHLKAQVGWGHFGAYKSFGVNEFLDIKLTDGQRKRAKALCEEILPRLKSTLDVEDIHIKGIWVGDLVYDTYLRTFLKPTINIESEDFRRVLLNSFELFTFWDDYFSSHKVCGINVSHCVYNLAIPLRLAVSQDIPVYQANLTHVYRLSRQNLFAYKDFTQFHERFVELPADIRKAGIALARHRIQRRFAGEVGVDMGYSSKSAYTAPKHVRLLRVSKKKKILIATHCFFDSPHSYGKNIFPDFYEWLDFLGKMTEVTDYDWYIKTHPDYLPGTMEIIESFVAKYPKFTVLPADASHHQIIAEGIDVALTVYGTIGFEYAALGVPVINSSLNNPHMAYDFNLHPRDIEDYRRLLLGLDHLNFSIDKQQVYEYYFMRHIYNTDDLFFGSYQAAVKTLGGYKKQFSSAIYEKWLDEFSSDKHQSIILALQTYVQSGDFRMNYKHHDRELVLEFIGAEK